MLARRMMMTARTAGYPTDGLLARWLFEGTPDDDIGPYPGTVYGATLTTDHKGVANSAYLFGGSPDRIEYGNVLNLSMASAFSIVALVTKVNNGIQESIIAKNNYNIAGYSILVQSTGVVRFGVSGNIDSLSTVDDSAPHLSICTSVPSGGNAVKKVYIDGPLDNSGTTVQKNISNSYPLIIGGRKDSLGSLRNSYTGKIIDVLIYNREITATESQSIADALL